MNKKATANQTFSKALNLTKKTLCLSCAAFMIIPVISHSLTSVNAICPEISRTSKIQIQEVNPSLIFKNMQPGDKLVDCFPQWSTKLIYLLYNRLTRHSKIGLTEREPLYDGKRGLTERELNKLNEYTVTKFDIMRMHRKERELKCPFILFDIKELKTM